MNSLGSIFITSFIVALSGALMPGPLLTATVGESSRSGTRAGPLLICGHAILEITLVAALFLGLAPLLKNAHVTAGIGLAGGAILIWMAYGMFRSLPRLRLESGASPGRGRGRLVAAGILVSLSNPYWSVWWATIGLAYILQSRAWGIAGVAVFYVGHILADFGWYSLVSVSVGKGRKYFTPLLYRSVVAVCAAFLVVFAGWFLWGGARTFLR